MGTVEQAEGDAQADGNLSKAAFFERKRCAKDLLTLWCDAITRDDVACFETEWRLGDAALQTPVKKRRTNTTTAVCDDVADDGALFNDVATAVADDVTAVEDGDLAAPGGPECPNRRSCCGQCEGRAGC